MLIRRQVNGREGANHPPEGSESGIAMLEMAIMAPFYVMMMLMVVDIIYAIHTHTQLYQIAKESVRVASNIPYMERGSFRCDISTLDPSTNTAPDYGCVWWRTTDMTQCYLTPPPHPGPGFTVTSITAGKPQSHVRLILLVNQMMRFQLKDLTIKNGTVAAPGVKITTCADYSNKDLTRMSVRIQATYDGLFRYFNGIGIKVKASGPYSS